MAILPQTTEDLTPGISIRGIIEESPSLDTTRFINLLGFVSDVSTLNSIASINTPIYVGSVTTQSSAVDICKKYGFRYKFLSNTALDMAGTDEIAAMLINAGTAYQTYAPSTDLQVIEPSQFIIGILDHNINGQSNPLFTYINPISTRASNGSYFIIPQSYTTSRSFTINVDEIAPGNAFVIENLSSSPDAVFDIVIPGCEFIIIESLAVTSLSLQYQSKMTIVRYNATQFFFSTNLVSFLDEAKTPYGDYFQKMIDQEIPTDIIVQSYEYKAGDSESSVNYLSELKYFSETMWNDGLPIKGRAWALLGNNSTYNDDDVGDNLAICNDPYSATIVFPQVVGNPTGDYQIPQSWYLSQIAICMAGMKRPYGGFYGQLMNQIPAPYTKDLINYNTIYSKDYVKTLNQYGYSTMLFNQQTNTVALSRLLVSFFENPTTGLSRKFMLDYQDFSMTYDFMSTVWKSLAASGIINTRFSVNKGLSSSVLSAVDDVAFKTAVLFFQEGMIALDPRAYADKFVSYLDKDNLSLVKFMAPYAASSIIYKIDGTVKIQNFEELLSNIAIVTGA